MRSKIAFLIRKQFILFIIFSAFVFQQCNTPSTKEDDSIIDNYRYNHADWTRDASVYEVNVRQFSEDGTFNAVEAELDRLKTLGVDILWLMPIHPIGGKNRKGPMGSYYAVKDYYDVNPEFGTMKDFESLVAAIHDKDMQIIIDWVPNHSSWDNALTETHPEFYMKDSVGNFVSPFDWTDVIRFDYENSELRQYMIDAMKFWVAEKNIDGFRCDVAHMVPVSFWEELKPVLDSIKPVFMLAESDQPELNETAFDATYDWKFHHIMNEIGKGNANATAVREHFEWVDSVYPSDSYLLQFTSNHDENSWAGTVFDRYGQGAKAFAVLSFTVPGMPLIYNGQEVGLDKMLEFFTKDPINWKESPFTDFYRTLNDMKAENQALHNGAAGGEAVFLETGNEEAVTAFLRAKDDNKVIVLINLSGASQQIELNHEQITGDYSEVFTGQEVSLREKHGLTLGPWEYRVLISKAVEY